jgi:hypothetical protein
MYSQAAYTSNEFINGSQTSASTLQKLFKTDYNKISVIFFVLYIYIYIYIYIFFFFYWRYNPLWVLAFSVIFFPSPLSLHNFLQPLIPIIRISCTFQVPNRITISVFRKLNRFREGSTVSVTEFFATF